MTKVGLLWLSKKKHDKTKLKTIERRKECQKIQNKKLNYNKGKIINLNYSLYWAIEDFSNFSDFLSLLLCTN